MSLPAIEVTTHFAIIITAILWIRRPFNLVTVLGTYCHAYMATMPVMWLAAPKQLQIRDPYLKSMFVLFMSWLLVASFVLGVVGLRYEKCQRIMGYMYIAHFLLEAIARLLVHVGFVSLND